MTVTRLSISFPIFFSSIVLFVFLPSPRQPFVPIVSAYSSRPPLCSVHFVNVRKSTNCSAKGFSRVPDRRSQVYGDTIVLHLANNRFSSLRANGFQALPFLQLLDLSKNRISNVSSKAFHGLQNLDVLDLSFNHLAEIPSRAFTDIRLLTSLKLRGNPLVSISQFSFAATPKLSLLDMSECRISIISPPVFARLSNLRGLHLHDNLLRTLDQSTLGKVPLTGQLRLLTLYRNPWHCDCRLRWLKLFVEAENVTFNGPPEMTSCATPKRLRDGLWSSLENRRFACPPTLYETAQKTTVVVNEFDPHNVTCKMTMDPIAGMLWYLNGRRLFGGKQGARRTFSVGTSFFQEGRDKDKAYSVVEFVKEKPVEEESSTSFTSSATPSTYPVSSPPRRIMTSILHISAVMNSTAGEFKCRAKNVGGVIESTSVVIVKRHNGGGGDILPTGDRTKEGFGGSSGLSFADEVIGNKSLLLEDGIATTSKNFPQRRNSGSRLLNGTVVIGGVVTGVVLVCFFLACGAVVFCFAKTNDFKFRNGSSDSVVFRQYGSATAASTSVPRSSGAKISTNGTIIIQNGAGKKRSISTDLDAIPDLHFHRNNDDDDKRDDDGAANPLLRSSCVSGGNGGSGGGVSGLARCVSATYISATSGERGGIEEEEEVYQRPIAPVDAYPTASIHAALIRDLPRSHSVPVELDPTVWTPGAAYPAPNSTFYTTTEAIYPAPIGLTSDGAEEQLVLHTLNAVVDQLEDNQSTRFIPASPSAFPQLTVVHEGLENPAYSADQVGCGRQVSPVYSIGISASPFSGVNMSVAPPVSIYALAPASVAVVASVSLAASPEDLSSYCPSLDTVTSMINAETPSPVAPIIVSVGQSLQSQFQQSQFQQSMQPQLHSHLHHPVEYLDEPTQTLHPHPVELMDTSVPTEYPHRDNSPINATVDTEV